MWQMCPRVGVGCWSQVRPACVGPGCTCCLLGLCPRWGCHTLVAYGKGVTQELQVCPQAAAAVEWELGRSPGLPWSGPLGPPAQQPPPLRQALLPRAKFPSPSRPCPGG